LDFLIGLTYSTLLHLPQKIAFFLSTCFALAGPSFPPIGRNPCFAGRLDLAPVFPCVFSLTPPLSPHKPPLCPPTKWFFAELSSVLIPSFFLLQPAFFFFPPLVWKLSRGSLRVRFFFFPLSSPPPSFEFIILRGPGPLFWFFLLSLVLFFDVLPSRDLPAPQAFCALFFVSQLPIAELLTPLIFLVLFFSALTASHAGGSPFPHSCLFWSSPFFYAKHRFCKHIFGARAVFKLIFCATPVN